MRGSIPFGVALVLVAVRAPAQKAPASCCAITDIQMATGIVTAKVTATGNVFQFKAPARTLASLRVGQGVFANFTAKQVSLDGRSVCCAITSGPTAPTAASQPPPQPAARAAPPPPPPAAPAAPPAGRAAGAPAPTGPAANAVLPAVKSVSFLGNKMTKQVVKGGPVWSATGGQEAVLRVELTAPAPCVEHCGGTTVDGQRSGYMPVLVSGNNPGQFNVQRVLVSTDQTVGEVKFVTSLVVSATSVVISAWSEGSAPQQATLTVLPPVLMSFVIDKTNVFAGEVIHATLTFSGPPASAGAVKVVVQTTNSQVLKVPASVGLGLNQTVAAFDVVALGVDQDKSAQVVAILQDKILPASVTVRAAVLKSIKNYYPCCVDPFRISLSGWAPTQGAVIKLISANPARIIVPARVTIPPGDSSIVVMIVPGSSLPIRPDDSSIVVTGQSILGNSATDVLITASYGGVSKSWSVYSGAIKKPDLNVTGVTLTDRFGNAITAPQDGQPFKMCAAVGKVLEGEGTNMPVPPSVLRVSYRSPTGTGTSTGRDVDIALAFASGIATITSCLDLPGLAPGGYHDVKLTADFRNEVDEVREGNNTRDLKITRPPTE